MPPTNPPSAAYRLVVEMQTDSDWNDAAPLFVILNMERAHVIESLSRLEAPCQAFARTLPDRVQEFAFEPPFSLFFSADVRLHGQLFGPSTHIALASFPADFASVLSETEVACQRAEWDSHQWIISGLIGDSSDRAFTAPFLVKWLIEAAQRSAIEVAPAPVVELAQADDEADDDDTGNDDVRAALSAAAGFADPVTAADLLARVHLLKTTVGDLNRWVGHALPVVNAAVDFTADWGDGREATGDERLTALAQACAQYRKARTTNGSRVPVSDSRKAPEAGPAPQEVVLILCEGVETSGDPVGCLLMPGPVVDDALLREVRDLAEYFGQSVMHVRVDRVNTDQAGTLVEAEAWVWCLNGAAADAADGDDEEAE
ncbi:MAG: hypothetical protein HY870_22455 [Chloroflexi bacterium]|nr:hypothetical protein [Chloroflexota bacterium]